MKPMKPIPVKSKIRLHIRANSKKYMFLLLSFMTGMILGSVSLMIFPEEMTENLGEYLAGNLKVFLSYSESLDKEKYFCDVFTKSLIPFFIVWAAGFTFAGVFFPPLLLAYRGYVTSFSFSLILHFYDGKGLLFGILVILSQNIIKIPSLMFAAMCAMTHSLRRSEGNIRGRKTVGEKGLIFAYTLLSGAAFAVYTAGIFVECYVIPYFVFTLAPDMI